MVFDLCTQFRCPNAPWNLSDTLVVVGFLIWAVLVALATWWLLHRSEDK
jgi:hypothetical protein